MMNSNEQVDLGLDHASEAVGAETDCNFILSKRNRIPFFLVGLQALLLVRVLLWFPDGNASCWWLLVAEAVAMFAIGFVGCWAINDFRSSVKAGAGPLPLGDERDRGLACLIATFAIAISFVVSANIEAEAPIFTPIWVSSIAGIGFALFLYCLITASFPFPLSKKWLVVFTIILGMGGLVCSDDCFQTYYGSARMNSDLLTLSSLPIGRMP